MKEKTTKLPTLEESLGEITGVIEKMENGELTLEQSLTQFERGIVLIKHCQKILTEAEQKVQMLVQQNQQETLTPYGDEKDDANDDTND